MTKFKPRDLVTPIRTLDFIDGTSHYVGKRYRVDETNIHYYNFYYDLYTVVNTNEDDTLANDYYYDLLIEGHIKPDMSYQKPK